MELLVLGGGLFLVLGLWTRAQPMIMRKMSAENITTSMAPKYMRSVTGGLEACSGSEGTFEPRGGSEVCSFITKFVDDDLSEGPCSLTTIVRLYSGTFCLDSGAPFT